MHVAARAAASRRLLLNEEAGTLNDPNPICQFCEVAVSYVKVRPSEPSECLERLVVPASCSFKCTDPAEDKVTDILLLSYSV